MKDYFSTFTSRSLNQTQSPRAVSLVIVLTTTFLLGFVSKHTGKYLLPVKVSEFRKVNKRYYGRSHVCTGDCQRDVSILHSEPATCVLHAKYVELRP